jgi:DNA invertase Pin-like site-specific DNA recombinase
MDTTTAQGRLIFNVFASFAEFERELASERRKAGLAAAMLKGRKGGRPKGLSKDSQTKAWAIHGMLNDTKQDYSAAEIQRVLNVPKNTYYRFKNWAIEQSNCSLKAKK